MSYPLTRNYYENNFSRIIFRNFLSDFAPSKSLGKNELFRKLRVKFVILQIIISE